MNVNAITIVSSHMVDFFIILNMNKFCVTVGVNGLLAACCLG